MSEITIGRLPYKLEDVKAIVAGYAFGVDKAAWRLPSGPVYGDRPPSSAMRPRWGRADASGEPYAKCQHWSIDDRSE